MQFPVAKVTDELWGLVRVHTDHPEHLMSLTPIPRCIQVDTRHSAREQEDAALADKAIAWMLAPVFFGCVIAERAKPQAWEPTAVFSRVVVSFMLKLFMLATGLTERGHPGQNVCPLQEGK
ncbi:unnamed protein product [Phytophthora fragariaefolia]|uniref:Unnamed protein product n=1 Tax=Phytophthora fragariaefolia TaxID=1490495 RepID=A0A9W6XZJ1_9STRA|nr:unnamed protein product [Phytophthora fragariaefolia]